NTLNLPTLLHFSAYRDIPKIISQRRQISEPDYWGYSPVRRFSSHSTSWENSLDNILVWMKWLDDGRLEKAVEIINKRVFQGSTTFIKGVRKTPPEAIVVSKGKEHGLDRLSSGEKNLVQLFLRIGAHCTRNSIILIDEPEIHLHPNWQKRLMKQLREFAQEHPGITIILATHSIEMLRAFGFEHKEKGLRKGGEIIEENME
ncbi:MAG: AAA family ATPase, partial [Candidatus Electrothrix sp.]